jgi:hypothetical protein
MTNHSPQKWLLRRIGYFSASLILFTVIVFLIVGIKEARRARLLRNDICKLELGKSNFAEVSRIIPKYSEYVGTHDNISASCSAEVCYYVLYIENPISSVFPIFPRTGFFATLVISDNTLRGRSLGIAGAKGQRYREASAQQSADSHFKEDTRIIIESKMPRKSAAIPFENSERFVELANELRLRCLVFPGVCSEQDEMLPFLRNKARSPR